MIELRPEEGKQDSMDEVVARDCRLHLERLDNHSFCLIIEDGERRVMLDIGAASAKYHVEAFVYSNEPIE